MTSIPARLAAATGPDRALDLEILIEVGLVRRRQHAGKWWLHRECDGRWIGYHGNLGDWRQGETPPGARYRVMSSIDAAVGLVERMLPGWEIELTICPPHASCNLRGPEFCDADMSQYVDGSLSPTAALAVLRSLFAALAKPGPGAVG